MQLIYKGKFDGNPDSLPHGVHQPSAVKFREARTPKQMAILGNALALVLTILALVGFMLRSDVRDFNLYGALVSLITLFPHEILHALCFKDTVYLYTNWKQGMLFVVGTETMSKTRFILMSLCPNIVFGWIPYILFMIFPHLTFFGTLGACALGMGAGDYYNVYNAATQMPKGARTYLYGFNSYWYMPQA